MNKASLPWVLAAMACLPVAGQTTTFELPPVSGVPTLLPVWSGFSPVVQQYGETRVQDTLAGTGSQALEMAPASSVAWSPGNLTAPSGNVLVSSFLLRLDTLSSDAPVIPSETLSAVVFANASGLMALNGNGAGGGTWQTLQALAADTFYSVTITRDYGSQTYDVEVDGSLVADNFGFKDPVADGPFTATFESSERAWLDDVSAAFTILPDTTPPGIASLSPADGASGVAVNTKLVLTLNKSVQKGTGSIRIKENLGNAIIANINVTTASVMVSGNVVIIALPTALDNGTPYYVEIDDGALADLSGNAFGGIAGSYTWSFTTSIGGEIGIYEPFDYTPTAGSVVVNSLNGGTGFGGVWYNCHTGTNPGKIVAGASLGSLPVSGGALQRTDRSGSDATARTISTNAQASLTQDYTTLWFSVLMKPGSDRNGYAVNSYGTLILGDTGLAGGAAPIGGAPAINANGNAIGVGFAGTQNATTNYADMRIQGVTYQNGVSAYGNRIVVGDSLVMIVGKVDWAANGTDDVLSLYNVTDPSGPLPTAFATMAVDLDQSTFNILSIGDAQTSLFDEIRFGTSFAEVVGNGTPAEGFESYISNPVFGLDPGEQGFNQDPDGDRLSNGLEAWFGTHPGEFNAGLTNLVTSGTVTTFTHPQNETRPADISGFYQWSPNLVDWYACDGVDGPPAGPSVTISLGTAGATTTVTAVASEKLDHLFLRFGVRSLSN